MAFLRTSRLKAYPAVYSLALLACVGLALFLMFRPMGLLQSWPFGGRFLLGRLRPGFNSPAMSSASHGHGQGNHAVDVTAAYDFTWSIFITPQDFVDVAARNQRRAIRSWTLLQPKPQIILLGKGVGYDDIAREFGCTGTLLSTSTCVIMLINLTAACAHSFALQQIC